MVERLVSRDDSVRAADLLRDLYRPRTGGLTTVPEAPIETRVDLVLGTLGLPARA